VRPVPLTVVGVARDASDVAIWREKEQAIYLPLSTSADMRDLSLIVRTSADASVLTAALRQHAAALDPDVAFDASAKVCVSSRSARPSDSRSPSRRHRSSRACCSTWPHTIP
jgi:hypothetical protein